MRHSACSRITCTVVFTVYSNRILTTNIQRYYQEERGVAVLSLLRTRTYSNPNRSGSPTRETLSHSYPHPHSNTGCCVCVGPHTASTLTTRPLLLLAATAPIIECAMTLASTPPDGQWLLRSPLAEIAQAPSYRSEPLQSGSCWSARNREQPAAQFSVSVANKMAQLCGHQIEKDAASNSLK
eukprot:COSAG05_NODE_3607_length_1963_cov_2.597639_1_plen_182_part_00